MAAILESWFSSLDWLNLPKYIIPDMGNVKKIHRSLSLKYHPDKCIDCDPADMVGINGAYSFVKDYYAEGVSAYMGYLHEMTSDYLPFTDIKVDEHKELLGELFHDYGVDGF